MILEKINNLTESLLHYYKKLVELEGAQIAFSLALVHQKINEIEVIRVKIEKVRKELQETFEQQTGLPFTSENFHDCCEPDTHLKIAHENLRGYAEACQNLLSEVMANNEHAMKVSEKALGVVPSEIHAPKFGKWGKRAKR
ncbi:hypothetical protein [Photobacterium galatheae]|uniref:Uncharacterized protein n=1 Tax=Photobacterium galatheae TaxID=1654360 RepID=A0A066RT42_9GAMM|nr:hypothetical protein [Photobacterium galatheae]KDM90862.1 hypothetical protein EA58_13965 [Photobacterium galatheae]MCM0149170.1 hypothetical protein [Photobacterium galatheae]